MVPKTYIGVKGMRFVMFRILLVVEIFRGKGATCIREASEN